MYLGAFVWTLTKAASQDEVSARLAAAAAERAQHQAALLEKDRELSDTRLVCTVWKYVLYACRPFYIFRRLCVQDSLGRYLFRVIIS